MHRERRSWIPGSLGCAFALIAAVTTVSAVFAVTGDVMHEGGATSTETGAMLRLEELKIHILPTLKERILSLTLQGAPVPKELQKLFGQGEAMTPETIDAFEQEAEHLFGSSWEEEWQEEIAELSLEERLRIYLGAIIEEAVTIARLSPQAPEDIRALATDLLSKLDEAKKEGKNPASLLPILRDRLAEIFPESTQSLPRWKVSTEEALKEFPDALAILLREKEGKRDDLTLRIAHLRASLPLLTTGRDITLFRQHFEDVRNDLLAIAPEIPIPQLREDFDILLQNLASTLRDAERVPLPLSEPLDAVAALKQRVRDMETEEDLRIVIRRLEEILSALRSTDTPSPLDS